MTARGPHPGRGKAPETITGSGELDERQRGEKLEAVDRRGRLAYVDGAEERSREAEGRPLSADELERVTKRYPG